MSTSTSTSTLTSTSIKSRQNPDGLFPYGLVIFLCKSVPIKVTIAIPIAIVFKKVGAKARAKAQNQFGVAWAQGPEPPQIGLWALALALALTFLKTMATLIYTLLQGKKKLYQTVYSRTVWLFPKVTYGDFYCLGVNTEDGTNFFRRRPRPWRCRAPPQNLRRESLT